MPRAVELNLEGLAGPTHTFAGLAFGNTKSMEHAGGCSRPRRAALQGLEKMRRLHERGVTQAVLPPRVRPDWSALHRAGFEGGEARVLERAHRENPQLLRAAYSASAMWAANAATVSPAADSGDGRVHFTPANLVSQLHRSLEVPHTEACLRRIFADANRFAVHPVVPADWPDEGAANHLRLAPDYGRAGLEVFVYGRDLASTRRPRRFPARQHLEAARCIASAHGLEPDGALFLQQDPEVIDQGVFHNDVICASDRDLLFAHEAAFAEGPAAFERIRSAYAARTGEALRIIRCTEAELPVDQAVETYLFNSQLVRDGSGRRVLVAPVQVERHPRAGPWLNGLLAEHDDAIAEVIFVDLGESIRNGGGPACLRLRVELSEEDLARVHPGVIFSEDLYVRLEQWVGRWYREELTLDELADPALARESREASEALYRLLDLQL